MFTNFTNWLKTTDTNPPPIDEHRLASLVTALMVEAASADGQVADSEKSAITTTIAAQFDLSDTKAQTLLQTALAQADTRIELHSLLRELRADADYEQRLSVIEMIWMVVLSDGKLDHLEAQLMRRLAGLLFVSDVDSGHAAKTARMHLGLDISRTPR